VSLAKKLREVVAANFIEIARVDTPPAKKEETPASLPPTPAEVISSAEAELDTFLKDIGATPNSGADALRLAEALAPAFAETPEPIIETVAPQPVLASLTDAISDEGDVDFDRVFKQYDLPKASFTAEQAMNMLQALPRDLPLRTKRVTVNTTLSAIGQVVGATPKDIVGDATRKRQHLDKYLEALSEEVTETTAATESEIERLQQEIAALRDKLRVVNRKRTAAIEVCQSRMHLFDQVVHFFDYDEATLNKPAAEEEEAPVDPDDMPAFMREDAVRRMLGINDEEGGEFDPVKFASIYGTGEDDATPPPAEDNDGGPRRGPRRRNGSREVEPVS